jgi:hypothetical protein
MLLVSLVSGVPAIVILISLLASPHMQESLLLLGTVAGAIADVPAVGQWLVLFLASLLLLVCSWLQASLLLEAGP